VRVCEAEAFWEIGVIIDALLHRTLLETANMEAYAHETGMRVLTRVWPCLHFQYNPPYVIRNRTRKPESKSWAVSSRRVRTPSSAALPR
jgi:hypothetical protein